MDTPNQPNQQQQPQYQQNIIIVGKQKSVGVAFLLAFFFGPLGLLYASVTGGIVMFFVGIVISIITLGFGIIFVWIGSIIWAVVAANNANSKAASGANININPGAPLPVQQNQPVQPIVQQSVAPPVQPLPGQPVIIPDATPIATKPDPVATGRWSEPIPADPFSDWVTKNKKGLIFAAGGIVIVLVLIVAVKYVVSLDFSHKKHTVAAADSTKAADSVKMADNDLGGDTDAPTQFAPAYGSTNNAASFPGVYPQASERLISPNDLVNLDKNALKFMRNEIFARHGYIFKTALMKNYFTSQNWYKPLYNNVDNQLSSIEKANVELIKSYEK